MQTLLQLFSWALIKPEIRGCQFPEDLLYDETVIYGSSHWVTGNKKLASHYLRLFWLVISICLTPKGLAGLLILASAISTPSQCVPKSFVVMQQPCYQSHPTGWLFLNYPFPSRLNMGVDLRSPLSQISNGV